MSYSAIEDLDTIEVIENDEEGTTASNENLFLEVDLIIIHLFYLK